jgi:hypothetical protein
MNMPGFSISLTNLSNISSACSIPTSTLLELIDAPHNSPSWPATSTIYPVPSGLAGKTREERFTEVAKEEKVEKKDDGKKILVDAELLRGAMKVAAEDVLALEPKLTEWDTVRGFLKCFVCRGWANDRLLEMEIVEKPVQTVLKPFWKRSTRVWGLMAILFTFSENSQRSLTVSPKATRFSATMSHDGISSS